MPRMYCSHKLIVLPLDVPTFTTSRLLEILAARGGTTSSLLEILAAKGGTNMGEKWPMNFA
jgi:hypothetical protein